MNNSGINYRTGKYNEVVVKTASQLSGVLVSNKSYFVDGLIDVTSIVPILVPSGGLYMNGHGYGISGLYSTGASDVLFQTPNAKQTISSDRTGGTFTLTFDGQTTSALNWNATSAQIDTALEALSNIGAGDVACTGGDLPNDVVVEFTSALAKTEVAVMTVTDSGTGGTSIAVAQTVAGYSGDFVIQNMYFYQSGAGSKLFDINNSGNFSAFELKSVNLGRFGATTPSFGDVHDYRQFRTSDFAAINFTAGITFHGNFTGFALTDSIGLSLVSGSTCLQAGTALSISDGFTSNMNYLSATGSTKFCDFAPTNFGSTAAMTLMNFRTNATDAIPNMPSTDIKSSFRGCIGITNTFVGGSWSCTTEAATTVSVNKTLYKIAGTTTSDLDAHFTMPASNRMRYDAARDIRVDITAEIELSSAGTESFELEARQWDASASSWIDLRKKPIETALKVLGDRRGSGTILAVADLEQSDYIEIWVQDVSASGTANPTMELQSVCSISERQS